MASRLSFRWLVTWCLVILVTESFAFDDYSQEKDSAYWKTLAAQDLQKSMSLTNPMRRARNVIMFIGDGMGPSTVTASRILAGQKQGKSGEEHRLSFDKFPYTGLSVTHSVDHQITDSASSATAFTSGVKTKNKFVGLGPDAMAANCTSSKGAELDTILDWFLQEGKAVGFVTTTEVTHATPGALYAHVPDRNWESDAVMPQEARDDGCKDIALQLVEDNPEINVILGGGDNGFRPLNFNHPRPDKHFFFAKRPRGRTDDQDLTKVWQDKKKEDNKRHKFVSTRSELNAVDTKNTDYLFGLFSEFPMAYENDRDDKYEPSLAEMTEKAIQVLKNNPKGFFLMVEGGRIDHGHHESKPSQALHDTVAFAKAVDTATRLTSESDTQIVVTADHSHTMSIAGYATRGRDILGTSDSKDPKDGQPYTTLVYGNGPGYGSPRQDITQVNTADKNYVSQSAVPMVLETHGGEDVAVYARGPQAHLYTGVHDNTYIPMVMAYSACVGPYRKEQDCAQVGDSAVKLNIPYSGIITLSLSLILKFV